MRQQMILLLKEKWQQKAEADLVVHINSLVPYLWRLVDKMWSKERFLRRRG